MSTWWGDCKKMQRKIGVFFFKTHFIRFEMHMDRPDDLKNFLGHHIKYLSIWPFMCHPWFPTRKASKLTFVCFQLQLSSPCNVFNTWCWKELNVIFEAFLDKVDFKKRPPWKKKFLYFFSIDSSSRHEKHCQILQRLFWLFQCSKNPLWPV